MALDTPPRIYTFATSPGSTLQGAPPDDADEDTTDDAEGEEEPDSDFREGGSGRYGILLAYLVQYHAEVDDMIDDLPNDVLRELGELDDLDANLLRLGVKRLPRAMQAELEAFFPDGIPPEDAARLADELADRDLTADPDRLVGWLVAASTQE